MLYVFNAICINIGRIVIGAAAGYVISKIIFRGEDLVEQMLHDRAVERAHLQSVKNQLQ